MHNTIRPTDGLDEEQTLLESAMHNLRSLHAQATPNSDEEAIAHRMLEQLGENTRNMVMSCLSTLRNLIEGPTPFPITEDDWPTTKLKLVEVIYAEYLHDLTLTTAGTKIHVKEFGRYLLNKYIRSLVSQGKPVEHFRNFGMLFFDVNDLKALIDCTSHENGTNFLRTIAQLFVSDTSTTRQWLSGQGILATPLTAGGDEFIILLRSQQALSQDVLDEAVIRFQSEVSSSEELSSFVNFKDPSVRDKCGNIKLPDTFTPSMAGGGALLSDAVCTAESYGKLSPAAIGNTFYDARLSIFDTLEKSAELGEQFDKQAFKLRRSIENPDMDIWAKRNRENQELAAYNQELRQEINELKRNMSIVIRISEEMREQVQSLLTTQDMDTERAKNILHAVDECMTEQIQLLASM